MLRDRIAMAVSTIPMPNPTTRGSVVNRRMRKSKTFHPLEKYLHGFGAKSVILTTASAVKRATRSMSKK
jgi:Mg-chelatase subunit ChlI